MISRLRRLNNNISKGLIKESDGENGSFSVNILFPNIDEEHVDRDDILKTEYGPTISREWLSDEPIDNPEWGLQSSFSNKI